MALTADRATKQRAGDQSAFPVAASTTIYVGGMVTLLATGGYAVPAGTASAGVCVGVAEQTVVNSGSAGDVNVPVRRGVFQFKNSASGDLIARADIGATCYIVDDETVAKTDDSGAREAAGIIHDVDANGVWVRI